MKHANRFRKDYYGGGLMTLVGLAAVVAGLQYRTGALSRMGPGFFPVAVGSLLALVGVLIAVTARSEAPQSMLPVTQGHSHCAPDLRGALCIVLGVLAFLLLGKYAGLIPATFAIVFISALGDRSNTLRQAVLLALVMCVVAAVVFWWALKLQLPLFTWGA
ncbi:hypothetical protein PTE30175_04838 [Pandoraea terrae]|uniref:DUF1468 domain-containing protein n=1 Tax=Pandoraea terrae TaxID=1537710 RepID=A0A5E4Z0B7_9BURK|nr:tripartite tricarboxylate transporter TctB family protein [Pandoraea terrae]VVE54536.1 hypothetical protein PTE30175_04838 [Pandoraea terrae]